VPCLEAPALSPRVWRRPAPGRDRCLTGRSA
jgi:hypothetical protein